MCNIFSLLFFHFSLVGLYKITVKLPFVSYLCSSTPIKNVFLSTGSRVKMRITKGRMNNFFYESQNEKFILFSLLYYLLSL